MTIYIGADHRGFGLKEKLVEWLKTAKYPVRDIGSHALDPQDDYPEIGAALASQVSADQNSLGILLCGSGIGMCVVANKVAGVRCCLGFEASQVKHGREADNCNVISLAADHLSLDQAQKLVSAFIQTDYQPKPERDRRLAQIDKLEYSL